MTLLRVMQGVALQPQKAVRTTLQFNRLQNLLKEQLKSFWGSAEAGGH